LFDKNARLSARVFGNVLNFPLYDADCCPAAREYLAIGNVAGAIAEWQRLADLGSGSARCVLAYLHLIGAPSIPLDLEEAKRIALSAVSGARGYANYLLGCIALKEKQPTEAVKYFVESRKAGFTPAATHLASMAIRGVSMDGKRKAISVLRQSAAAGHWPALLMLAGAYMLGRAGFSKRPLGLVLFVPAFIRVFLAIKYQIFSIHCFQYMARPGESLFNEEGLRRLQQPSSVELRLSRKTMVRWTHAFGAITAAVVVAMQSESFAGRGGKASVLTLVGWGFFAAWPYGLSYWFGSTVTTSLISTLIQTMALCLVTTLACSAYLGQLFDYTLTPWGVVAVTSAQAYLVLVAFGTGEHAAREVEGSEVPIPSAQQSLVWAHLLLGLVAAASWLSRSTIWHVDYWRNEGFNLASYMLLAMLPYVTSAVLSWRLVTANRWKPWAFVAILVVGTALAVVNNSGIWELEPGLEGVWLVLVVQFIGFILASEWALDGTEW
jgi:hypothetical protein